MELSYQPLNATVIYARLLSVRGENLSSVLQAICDTAGLNRVLSHWIQELTPMDVVDLEFVPDAAGKILVCLVEEG